MPSHPWWPEGPTSRTTFPSQPQKNMFFYFWLFMNARLFSQCMQLFSHNIYIILHNIIYTHIFLYFYIWQPLVQFYRPPAIVACVVECLCKLTGALRLGFLWAHCSAKANLLLNAERRRRGSSTKRRIGRRRKGLKNWGRRRRCALGARLPCGFFLFGPLFWMLLFLPFLFTKILLLPSSQSQRLEGAQPDTNLMYSSF